MPTYTYQCNNCGVRFDRYQKFEDQPLSYCPECNKKSLRKIYAPVGIVFKGSGFYATDHRSPSGLSSSPVEKSTKAEKSEPKPEKPNDESSKKSADKVTTPTKTDV